MTTTIQPEKLTACRKEALCERITQIAADGPGAIDRRLDELSREWTTGRLVKATTGVMLFAGLALTAFVSPWWLILMGLAGITLVQYWFFPSSWLAMLYAQCGFRSGARIEDERLALRVLRGDFKHLPTIAEVDDRDAVTRMVDEGGPALDDDDEKFAPKEAADRILHQIH
jgi:hypothetical protein